MLISPQHLALSLPAEQCIETLKFLSMHPKFDIEFRGEGKSFPTILQMACALRQTTLKTKVIHYLLGQKANPKVDPVKHENCVHLLVEAAQWSFDKEVSLAIIPLIRLLVEKYGCNLKSSEPIRGTPCEIVFSSWNMFNIALVEEILRLGGFSESCSEELRLLAQGPFELVRWEYYQGSGDLIKFDRSIADKICLLIDMLYKHAGDKACSDKKLIKKAIEICFEESLIIEMFSDADCREDLDPEQRRWIEDDENRAALVDIQSQVIACFLKNGVCFTEDYIEEAQGLGEIGRPIVKLLKENKDSPPK